MKDMGGNILEWRKKMVVLWAYCNDCLLVEQINIKSNGKVYTENWNKIVVDLSLLYLKADTIDFKNRQKVS